MVVIVLLIFVALAFDFMNGFHDAANSIATIVSTRVLTPRAAVAWAAFFNFVAAFGFVASLLISVSALIISFSALGLAGGGGGFTISDLMLAGSNSFAVVSLSAHLRSPAYHQSLPAHPSMLCPSTSPAAKM